MRSPNARHQTMPAFRNAAEKRAWLLEQLKSVERDALFEDIAAGRNERITIRMRGPFRIDVGSNVLYDGADSAEFVSALAGIVEALPLGSQFVVEAGRGGKVLSGGVDEEPARQEVQTRKSRARAAGTK